MPHRRTPLVIGLTAAASLLSALVACGDDAPVGAPAPTTVVPVDDDVDGPDDLDDLDDLVTIVAELGYPRDLLDRNRVNLVVTRPDTEPFEIVTKQLRMSGYEPDAPEERRTIIPGNGQRVALQTLLGTVTDCDRSTPMAAALDVTYRFGGDPTLHTTSLTVDDVTTLADIRTRHCTAEMIGRDFRVGFDDVTVDVDDETATATVTIERVAGDESLVIETITGTVLVGVEVLVAPDERSLPTGTSSLSLPVRFDVNRCDSHAVAETTRRYGVDLWIGTADVAGQRIAVDIGAIEDHLAAMVARCQARTRSE
jgi:hypothetical protein